MALTTLQTQRWIYLIFGLSGFTGIIYESVWSHYLKLLLGHAAYAHALVLIIFMGGMALGAWIISRTSHLSGNLLIWYALIEGIIGVFGLVFHPLYELLYSVSFETVIPAIGIPFYVYIYKFTLASLLILPQSILLGATFPLMSSGFVRRFPNTPGKSISLLYFANSCGAAIGLLVSTFYLIGKLGLSGTIFSAGILNIIIAILVYRFANRSDLAGATPTATPHTGYWPSLLITAAFFTGMASFIYEVVWIRMLSMVLGASTHSFELMLSAFITGLAIGGYWIRRKIDTLQDPVGFAGIIQITMGIFAVATIFLYSHSFDLMAFFMSALDETPQGYLLFTLASHSIALLIMLPATICAGMTLPLFTYILLMQGRGEKAIGQIYSSNTIGAIIGVIFTVFIGMPLLTLKGSILVGAVIDVAIGLLLIQRCSGTLKLKYSGATAAVFVMLVTFTVFFFDFNIKQMASGVYRYGIAELDDKSDILFHQDGKTASITVTRHDEDVISIMTNGKPDASVNMDENLPPSTDEATMTLLAALPLSIFPEAKTVANIGMGSGLTTHTALTVPTLERVDTIEIEDAIISGARFFMPKIERVYNDPRSYIHVDDARTFFSTHKSRYDIIISEPSNPWVSGVSSLFTSEFYDEVSAHLNEGGLLVQWMHIYELNLELLVSVLKAISGKFPYYSVYFADDSNLILLASVDKPVGIPNPTIFESPEMNRMLSTIHIHNIDDIRVRFLGDQSLYTAFIESSDTPANSDFYPFLDQNAAKARFLNDNVTDLLDVRLSPVPVLDILYGDQGRRTHNLTPTKYYPGQPADDAYNLYLYFSGNSPYSDTNPVTVDNVLSISSLNFLLGSVQSCPSEQDSTLWVNSIFRILSRTVAYLTPDQLKQIVTAITPACETGALPENISNWLTLFRSYSQNNYALVLETTMAILEAKSRSNLEQAQFLYTSLLAGLFKIGEHEQITRLWNDFIADLYVDSGDIPLEIQLLLGQTINNNPSGLTD